MTKVLVTGASGYIAKHIILQLLQSGYQVRGSVRALNRGKEIIDAITPHLGDGFNISDNLEFVPLDLTKDDGWADAMNGIDVLMHTASPFPMDAPKHEDELVRPAVDGTLRALQAANDAGIRRVILTSSTASVIYRAQPEGGAAFDESYWTDVNHPSCTPYSKSKTLAERAAWQFIKEQAPDMQLTAINPGFVIGAPLDSNFGTSMKVLLRLLAGKDPALPRIGFFSVDVRDVAAAHVGAIDNLDTVGLRILVVERFLWFADLAEAVAKAFPERKIVTRLAPNWLIRFLGLFDKQIRSILPMLGLEMEISNARAKDLLAIDFIDTRKSAANSARFLIDNKLV